MPDDSPNFLPPFPDTVQPSALASPQPAPPISAPSAAPAVSYAGFWRRFWAFLIDGLILFIAGMAANLLMRALAGVPIAPLWKESSGGTTPYNCLETFVGVVIGWVYAASFVSSEKQATIGKMAIGIKVTDLFGRRISFLRATGRHFAQIFDLLTLLIGYAMAGFTAKKQALHDKIAGTLVIRA